MRPRAPDQRPPVLDRIVEYHYKDEFTQEEWAAFRDMAGDLATATHSTPSFFILGCFETGEHSSRNCLDRVVGVKELINEKFGTQAAYLMDDFPDLHAITKFQIIVDEVDHIFCVVEHDKGGVMIEQGLLAAVPDAVSITHLLKRDYDTIEEEHAAYSWMQTEGIFDIFEYHDHLHRWETKDQLLSDTDALIDSLTS